MLKYRRRDKLERRRLREQPISRLFPNIITLAGMCCGLSAIRFALLGNFELSVTFILIAALLDATDGRVARMLGASSEFGAQLDSLSDLICFAVAPVLIMYIWQLHTLEGIGWGVVLFVAVCGALRLARFNTALFDDNQEPWERSFFIGIPSPMGGILGLLPLILFLQLGDTIDIPSAAIAANSLLIGALMASRIPTYSGKDIRISHHKLPYFMLGAGLLLVFLITEVWAFLTVICVCYLLTIPFSSGNWNKLKKRSLQKQAELSQE